MVAFDLHKMEEKMTIRHRVNRGARIKAVVAYLSEGAGHATSHQIAEGIDISMSLSREILYMLIDSGHVLSTKTSTVPRKAREAHSFWLSARGHQAAADPDNPKHLEEVDKNRRVPVPTADQRAVNVLARSFMQVTVDRTPPGHRGFGHRPLV